MEQSKTEPNDRTYLDSIRVSGNNLSASISELPDMSSVKSGALPLQPVIIASGPRRLASSSGRSANMKVLVVDDNIMNQRVLEGYLQGHQVKTVIVGNGPDAIDILKNDLFDIIFISIQLPEMDGYTTTQIIRQQLLLSTPIIAMTSDATANEQECCRAAGMNECLSRPIRMEQLDDVLAHITVSRQNRENVMNTTVTIGADIIHVSFLDELVDGDNELLSELVALFMRDLESYQRTLFESTQLNNRDLFKQTSHKFRSSINSLAMIDVAKRLRHLETNDNMDNLAVASELTTVFKEINEGLLFLKQRIAM